jgi:CheY-like chemotaxis protein
MPITRILLVDDDEVVRMIFTEALEEKGFAVTCASNVVEALNHITSGSYDALVSDLHMPGAGDGLTVVSAMRHANPSAVTFLLSAFPQMEVAAQAILLQADEILVKPMEVTSLVDQAKNSNRAGPHSRDRECGCKSGTDDRGHHSRVVWAHPNGGVGNVRSDDPRAALCPSAPGLPGPRVSSPLL